MTARGRRDRRRNPPPADRRQRRGAGCHALRTSARRRPSPAPRSHPVRRFHRRAARPVPARAAARSSRQPARGERIGDRTGPAGRTRPPPASAGEREAMHRRSLTRPARSSSASASPDWPSMCSAPRTTATSSEVSAAITASAVRVSALSASSSGASGERHVGRRSRHVRAGGTPGALVGRQRAHELDRDSGVAAGERGHAADHPIGRRHGRLHRRGQRLDVQSVEHQELVADRDERVGGAVAVGSSQRRHRLRVHSPEGEGEDGQAGRIHVVAVVRRDQQRPVLAQAGQQPPQTGAGGALVDVLLAQLDRRLEALALARRQVPDAGRRPDAGASSVRRTARPRRRPARAWPARACRGGPRQHGPPR